MTLKQEAYCRIDEMTSDDIKEIRKKAALYAVGRKQSN